MMMLIFNVDVQMMMLIFNVDVQMMMLIFNIDVQMMVSDNFHQWSYHTHLMLSTAFLSTCIPMHLLCQLLIRIANILQY